MQVARGRLGSFGAGVYFIFIRGTSGPLCGWLRGRMGSYGFGVHLILMWGVFQPRERESERESE